MQARPRRQAAGTKNPPTIDRRRPAVRRSHRFERRRWCAGFSRPHGVLTRLCQGRGGRGGEGAGADAGRPAVEQGVRFAVMATDCWSWAPRAGRNGARCRRAVPYWRDCGCAYVTALCCAARARRRGEHTSSRSAPGEDNGRARGGRPALPVRISDGQRAGRSVARLDEGLRCRTRPGRASVRRSSNHRNTDWNLVGRVHFISRRTARTRTLPSTFIATLHDPLVCSAKAQHVPLGKAPLQEKMRVRTIASDCGPCIIPVQPRPPSMLMAQGPGDAGEIISSAALETSAGLQFPQGHAGARKRPGVMCMPASWAHEPARTRPGSRRR